MNLHGICQLTMIPLRREPSDKSEMVTQLIFGETFDVLTQIEGWSQIITHFDNYTGWISTKMGTMLDPESMNIYSQQIQVTLKEPFAILHSDNTDLPALILAGGSSLIINSSTTNTDYPWLTFDHSEIILSQPSSISLIKNALKFINAPYLWGGRTIFGTDCSGLTQIIYKMAGYKLPRDASQQAIVGRITKRVEDSLPGDLAFFGKSDGKITHTGMILENLQIIHCSGKVRIDKIDNHGIYNSDTKTYSHELLMIKRIND